MDEQYRLLELAMMAMATGNPSSAIKHCEAYLQIGPGDAYLYKTYATALLLVNRLDEAVVASEALDRLADQDPKVRFDSGIVLGEVALRQSRSDQSKRLEHLNRSEAALDRATSLLDYAGKYGRCLAGALHAEVLLDQGRVDVARRVISRVLETLRGTTLEGPGLLEENTRETSALASAIKRAGMSVNQEN